MGPVRQPGSLTAFPQSVHSPYLTIHTFSLLQPLPPAPPRSLSVDSLLPLWRKLKQPKKTSTDPTILVTHLPETAPTPSALHPWYVLSVVQQIPYLLSPTSLIILSLLNHSQVHANMLLFLPKKKKLLNPTVPISYAPLCTKNPWRIVYTHISKSSNSLLYTF